MPTRRHPHIDAPVAVDSLPVTTQGDDLWQKQRQSALQAVILCQIYFAEYEAFPSTLAETLELFDHDQQERNRVLQYLTFIDPASGEPCEWIYNPIAEPNSSELIITSPESSALLRIVCTADGIGKILEEKDYLKLHQQG